MPRDLSKTNVDEDDAHRACMHRVAPRRCSHGMIESEPRLMIGQKLGAGDKRPKQFSRRSGRPSGMSVEELYAVRNLFRVRFPDQGNPERFLDALLTRS